MDSQKWKKIKNILEEAMEFSPAARSEYLARVCDGEEDLRREVESLLAFDDTNADLLENFSAFESAFDLNESALVGSQIGKYKIVSELGAGGMGAVYLAERADGAFEQKTALKIVKRGMNSEAVLRRFFNERQILAALEHPNIARLIDGGTTDDGLPYFVMEYVEGETIADYVERVNLNLKERLKIFRQVCAAVSFAHQNLVIHRDLKPSNILVTRNGTPKLLDFGIAKLLNTQNAGETATQNFVFTPEYASPEQVRGEKLTTATDVYSLGVILYELLTGNRPYQTHSRNISEIIRVVCETEPVRPSSIVNRSWRPDEKVTSENKQQRTKDEAQRTDTKSKIQNPKSLEGDLDNIILKSLRKEPERRYSSVEQFSEDVRRHLEGLPVSASRDTLGYRISKFVNRNRLAVGAAALVLLTLFAGLGATLYQADVARRERVKAEQRFNDVRQLANSFLFEFHDSIESLPGSTPSRELVVKRAIEYLDKLAAASNDAVLQRELAAAYARIGQIQGNSYYSNLGDTDGALRSYRRSLELRQRLADADRGNPELQNELVDSHEGVGDMLYTINDLPGGLQAYEKAVAIREKIVAEVPDNLDYRYSLAVSLSKHGDISGMEGFPNLGNVPAALESYRRSVGLYEKLVESQPENEKYKLGYATALFYVGMLQTTTGDSKGAMANGQRSIAIIESMIAANPNNAKYETHLMSALVSMRYPLLDEGRIEEAIQNARRVVHTMEKMVAADPKNAYARRSLSVSYNSLGICLRQAGDARGAIENHRRSLTIIEELSAANSTGSENNRDISVSKQYLAEAMLKAGETDAALTSLRQIVSELEKAIEAGDSNVQTKDDLSINLINAGKALEAKGDLRGATEAFRRAIPLVEEVIGENPHNVRVKSRYADSYLTAGKVLAKLARAETGKNRETAGSEACGYLKRSFDLWTEMRRTGTLSAIYINRPVETVKEMTGCNNR